MSDSNNYTFTWPAGPKEVILTGTFDDWKGSLPLVKTSSGSFEITTPLPEPKEEDDGKIYFKFIVDGDWTVSDNYEKESDGCGFQNNFVDVSNITANAQPANVTRIPEAGGLAATIVAPPSTENNDGTVHILPIEEPKTAAVDNIGGPGPVIPEDPANIKEFSEIRDVDAKELNERLNKELKAKRESNVAKEVSTTEEQLEEETKQVPVENVPEEANNATETEEKVEEAEPKLEEDLEEPEKTVEEATEEPEEMVEEAVLEETNTLNETKENVDEAKQAPEEIESEEADQELQENLEEEVKQEPEDKVEETHKANETEEKVEEDIKQQPQVIVNDGDDADHTIEAEIPVIQVEDETNQYDRAPEPLPETKIPTENKKKETKPSKPVKKATKPIVKAAVNTRNEDKKPKKGIFSKLKKIFT